MLGCIFVCLDVFLYVWMYFWSGSEPPGWKGVCSEENTFPPEKHGITPEGSAFPLFLCLCCHLFLCFPDSGKICTCMWWSVLSHPPDSSYPKERCSFLACYSWINVVNIKLCMYVVAYHSHVHAIFTVFQGHSSVKQFKLTWSNSNSDIYIYDLYSCSNGIIDAFHDYNCCRSLPTYTCIHVQSLMTLTLFRVTDSLACVCIHIHLRNMRLLNLKYCLCDSLTCFEYCCPF